MNRISFFALLLCFLPLVISAQDGGDFVTELVKKAEKQRKQNQLPAPKYSYQAYTKSALRFPAYFPIDTLLNRTLFRVLKPEKEARDNGRNKRPAWMPPDLDSEILYLSENLSEIYIKKPHHIKERIKTSRVSGELTRFSFIGSLVARYDPYQNRFPMPGISEYGLISPLADIGTFFYSYELLEETASAYTIGFTSKRKYEDTFNGSFVLDKNSLAVRQIDFWTSKKYGINLLDSLKIHQDFEEVFDGKWVPVRTHIEAGFSLNLLWIKVPFIGYTLSETSNYRKRTELPSSFWDDELIRVETHMSEKGNAILEAKRPIPLDKIEAFDYYLKDSLKGWRSSDAYLDSLTQNQNWFNAQSLILLGTKKKNYRLKYEFSAEQLLSSVGFNPMEGFFVQPNFTFSKTFPSDQKLQFNMRLRYAFSAQKFSYMAGGIYETRPKFQESIRAYAGDYISEFSRFSQVGFFPNTQATLLNKESLMRLYRKKFWELGYRREVINGLKFSADLRFENRSEMPNMAEFSFSKDSMAYAENFSLENHQALIGEIGLSYTPFSKYISSPNSKYPLGSVWPTFSLSYLHSFAGISPGAADFSRLHLSVSKDRSLGFLGSSRWRLSFGSFLKNDRIYFPDYYHFKATPTTSRPDHYDAFFLIDFYQYSTRRAYLEAHLEQELGGFIFDKIPGYRLLRLREYVGLHYLKQQGQSSYLELNVGVEKMFLKVFGLRVDLYLPVIGGKPGDLAIKYIPPGPLIKITE